MPVQYFLIVLENKLMRPHSQFFLVNYKAFVDNLLLVLGEPQPDPWAVEALFKLCAIVPPPSPDPATNCCPDIVYH